MIQKVRQRAGLDDLGPNNDVGWHLNDCRATETCPAMQVRVQDAPGAMELLRRSSRQRQKASTGLNLQSSRSHSVFGISLRWRPGDEESSMGQVPEDAEGSGTEGLFWGRLSIVDLAGAHSV